MPLKIISGGQTGADIAGLKAAKLFHLITGGNIPKGFRTLKGSKPEYKKIYGLVETPSSDYPPRTYLNVKESDGTIRFFRYRNSPGELCTLKAIVQYKKPFFDVDLNQPIDFVIIEKIIKWLEQNNIRVLNVSGNSEQTSPGIEKRVLALMLFILKKYS